MDRTMSQGRGHITQKQIRSPRSAGFAGVLFALMQIGGMIVINSIEKPLEFSREWISSWSGPSTVVLFLVPFSGIAFLWFTGVMRDLIGDREDRFFGTVFLGSGLLYVGLMFVWAAMFGAIFRSLVIAPNLLEDNDIFIFGFAFMNEIIGNYLVRMAGVYMLSTGTIWIRSGVAPIWLIILTYVLAFSFLFFFGRIGEIRYVFPAWVLVVSVYILVVNYRRKHEIDMSLES